VSDLPHGWIRIPIGETITLNPKNISTDDTAIGFVPMPLLGTSYLGKNRFEIKKWAEVKRGYTHFANGDVLLAKITPCFENGKAGIVTQLPNGLGAGSTEFFVCRPNRELLNGKYLVAFFKTREFLKKGEVQMTGSVGHKRVPKDYLLNTIIPLPPLDEQKRIADKLDILLAAVDACRARLDKVPALIKRFRQSVLAAAMSGKLTEDWRKSNQISGKWGKTKLREIAESRLGKMLDKSKNQGVPTTYLRNINVRWFGFDLSDLLDIRVTENEIHELSIQNGDVLICEGGEPGRCAVWSAGVNKFVFQKALHRVRPNKSLLPLWLCFNLKNDADTGRLETYFTGTTIKHFTGTALSKYEIRMPNIREQNEIVRRVEALFTIADKLETRLAIARARVDQLTPSILAQAFRGELVPQDPRDEPASALLEKIANPVIAKRSLKKAA
jgi:type I restriction enzyme S subunit